MASRVAIPAERHACAHTTISPRSSNTLKSSSFSDTHSAIYWLLMCHTSFSCLERAAYDHRRHLREGTLLPSTPHVMTLQISFHQLLIQMASNHNQCLGCHLWPVKIFNLARQVIKAVFHQFVNLMGLQWHWLCVKVCFRAKLDAASRLFTLLTERNSNNSLNTRTEIYCSLSPKISVFMEQLFQIIVTENMTETSRCTLATPTSLWTPSDAKRAKERWECEGVCTRCDLRLL